MAEVADFLDLYAQEPDENRPLVCLDEKPIQLLENVRPRQRTRTQKTRKSRLRVKTKGDL